MDDPNSYPQTLWTMEMNWQTFHKDYRKSENIMDDPKVVHKFCGKWIWYGRYSTKVVSYPQRLWKI